MALKPKVLLICLLIPVAWEAEAATPNLSGDYAVAETQNCPQLISHTTGKLQHGIARLTFTPSSAGAQKGKVTGHVLQVACPLDGSACTTSSSNINAHYTVTANKIVIGTAPASTIWTSLFSGLQPDGTATHVDFVYNTDGVCVTGGTLDKY